MNLDQVVELLIRHQRARRFAIKSEQRSILATKAFVGSRVNEYHWSSGNEAPPRQMVFKIADDIIDAVERRAEWQLKAETAKSQDGHIRAMRKIRDAETVLEPWAEFLDRFNIELLVGSSVQARQPWTDRRDEPETAMRELARQLPVWEWVQSIRGISDKGLAVIVGETGNWAEYPTIKKLYKRLGVGVFDGKRQGCANTKAEYIEHGYRPARRAETWVFLDHFLYNQQARVSPVGHYAQVCRDYKQHQIDRNEAGMNAELAADKLKHNPGSAEAKYWREGRISPGHIDGRARRYMAKAFITDLWREWHARTEKVLSVAAE